MLDFLRGKTSDRKLRLFAVGCYRHILHLISDQRSIHAVLVAERFVEGAASLEELRDATREARQAYDEGVPREGGTYHTNAALGATYFASEARHAAEFAAAYAAYAVGDDAVGNITACPEAYHRQSGGQARERQYQVGLLRHIIGDPFQPYPAPASWPSAVIQLADAFANGQDCGFALHDALLDAGHPDLADHFRQEQAHPKGCWVLDLILGKS
ncbi:MAG: hypothetical protein K2R98_05390 [Gemmataceae bacterium]|nr:hypothetical protein [Gemmataceae bacterium]